MRAQGSIEFLFTLSVIMSLLVVILVPGLRAAELSIAAAATRTALSSSLASSKDAYSTSVELVQKEGRRVDVVIGLVNRTTRAKIQLPDGLKNDVAFGIQSAIAPAKSFSGFCASSENYDYCVV